MYERISTVDKKPEAKRHDFVRQIRRNTESSQSMNSPVERILFLQRTIGNQAVGRLIKSGALQAKLRISQPGDIYEQEADRVAEQVMRMPDVSSAKDTRVQRKCPKCLKGLTRLLGKDKKEEKLQAKGTAGNTPEVTPQMEANINALRGGGQPLPESTRAFFEPVFGHDFSRVMPLASASKHTLPAASEPVTQSTTRLLQGYQILGQTPAGKVGLEIRQASGLAQGITPPSGPGYVEFPPTVPDSGTCKVGRSESNCFPAAGHYLIGAIINDCCTEPCTVEHEKQHVRDYDECCMAYSQALIKPGADQLALQKAWNTWKEQVRPISECRAYMNDIACAQRLAVIKGCVPETGWTGEALASGGVTATGGDEALSQGTAQKPTSHELEQGITKPVVTGVKALDACCIDINWYEQTFAGEAKQWCDRAGGKAVPPCPFTTKSKKTTKPKKP